MSTACNDLRILGGGNRRSALGEALGYAEATAIAEAVCEAPRVEVRHRVAPPGRGHPIFAAAHGERPLALFAAWMCGGDEDLQGQSGGGQAQALSTAPSRSRRERTAVIGSGTSARRSDGSTASVMQSPEPTGMIAQSPMRASSSSHPRSPDPTRVDHDAGGETDEAVDVSFSVERPIRVQ